MSKLTIVAVTGALVALAAGGRALMSPARPAPAGPAPRAVQRPRTPAVPPPQFNLPAEARAFQVQPPRPVLPELPRPAPRLRPAAELHDARRAGEQAASALVAALSLNPTEAAALTKVVSEIHDQTLALERALDGGTLVPEQLAVAREALNRQGEERLRVVLGPARYAQLEELEQRRPYLAEDEGASAR
jgi:hypothetical protein